MTRRLLFAGLAASALAACGGRPDALDAAREALGANLPEPYFEDLVTESVIVQGRRLVLVVRSPGGDADKTRQHPQFERLRQSEQEEMRTLCALAPVQALAGTDVVLVRRFVDRQDKVFFETTLPARDCGPQT